MLDIVCDEAVERAVERVLARGLQELPEVVLCPEREGWELGARAGGDLQGGLSSGGGHCEGLEEGSNKSMVCRLVCVLVI